MGPHQARLVWSEKQWPVAVVNPATIEATPFALSLSKGVDF